MNKYIINNNKGFQYKYRDDAALAALSQGLKKFNVISSNGRIWEYETNGKYLYMLESLYASSQKYGTCWVCHKHASEMFIQMELAADGDGGWTAYKCHDLFGHKKCLIKQRRILK